MIISGTVGIYIALTGFICFLFYVIYTLNKILKK